MSRKPSVRYSGFGFHDLVDLALACLFAIVAVAIACHLTGCAASYKEALERCVVTSRNVVEYQECRARTCRTFYPEGPCLPY